MDYQEGLPPEHINTSPEHPLKELAWLLAGALLLIGVLALTVHFSAGWLARLIPLETEQQLFAKALTDTAHNDTNPALERYLQSRLQALLEQMDVPKGLSVTLSVSDSKELNAFAAPGSNIVLLKGLLHKLPHENALSMLLAHELAHVIHRDPITGFAQSASVSLLLALLGSEIDFSLASSGSQLLLLSFTRHMEDRADEDALQAIAGVYGHTQGAGDLFKVLQQQQSDSPEIPAFFTTHLHLNDRIAVLKQRAMAKGYATEGEITPLPPGFMDWL